MLPPQPIYPYGLDTDFTLFKVFNTTESMLATANPPWSSEIEIIPVLAGEKEIWAENGYATINGELLYYDAVSKNSNNKINILKRCTRNISGNTRYNKAGEGIRGFVVAEHHNQLVNVIIKLEKFIGLTCICDEIDNTLSCRIKEMECITECLDDDVCANVTFDYEIVSTDTCAGTTINYNADVTGSFTFFKLDFGDGTSTSTPGSGTHTYPANITPDPSVTVRGLTCEIVQTGVRRNSDNQPTTEPTPEPLLIQSPLICIPNINVSIASTEIPVIPLPPQIAPCFDFGSLSNAFISFGSVGIPSVISFGAVDIPSQINFGAVSIPSIISISPSIPNQISLISDFDIPDTINFGPMPMISFGRSPLPSIISFGKNPLPSVISIKGGCSSITVNWGQVPTISVVCGGTSSMGLTTFNRSSMNVQDLDFDEQRFWESQTQGYPTDKPLEITSELLGIPSEIKILPPDIPAIKFENLPETIMVEALNIPSKIELVSDKQIPSEIRILAPDFSLIKFDVSDLPSFISVQSSIPSLISFGAIDIPSVISIDGSSIPRQIDVVGIPEQLSVVGFPDSIRIKPLNPEDFTVNVAPIEVVVKVDMEKMISDGPEGKQCFYFVPCK